MTDTEIQVTLVDSGPGGGGGGNVPLGDAADRARQNQSRQQQAARTEATRREKGQEEQIRSTNLLTRAIESLAAALGLGGILSYTRGAFNAGAGALAAVRGGASSFFGNAFSAAAGTRIGSAASRARDRFAFGFGDEFAARTATRRAAGSAAARAAGAGGAAAAGGGTAAGGAAAGGVMAAVFNPVVIGAAAVVAAFAGLVIGTKKLFDVFEAQANELRRFSPQLNAIESQREIQRELNLRERAERVGPQMAQISAARARFEDAMSELVTAILEELLKYTPIFEAFLDTLTAMLRIIVAIKEVIDVVFADPQDFVRERREAERALMRAAQAIQDIFVTNQNVPLIDPVISQLMVMDGAFLQAGRQAGQNPVGNGQRPNAGQRPVPNPPPNPQGP